MTGAGLGAAAGRRVGIIAHRGASGYAPENTAASFARAVEMGAAAVEFDVQQSRDGRLVVVHDTTLKRTAGLDRAVGELDYAEIARLDAGAWFSPRFEGERVPLLEEVLDLLARLAGARAPGPELQVHLEIKQPLAPYPGIERRVLECLKSRPAWAGRVVVSSFHHASVRSLRALDERLRLGYLVGLKTFEGALAQACELRCESLDLSLRRVDRRWIDAARERGLRVHVYTVNSPADLTRLREWGVDAVFTNYPDLKEEGAGP